MREGVLAHDRLVVLHREGRDGRDQLRGAGQHRRLDARLVGQHVAASADRHHDFFQRRIARPLAEAVDRALDLPCAARDAGQRIGDREAEIVMAMGREDRLVGIRHARDHLAEHRGIFLRNGIADRVGQVDRRGAGLDRGVDAANQIVDRRAGRVHRRPLDILDEVARLLHRGGDDVEHLLLALAHLVREMDRRGGDEGVDARALGDADRLAGAGDVARDGAGEAGDGHVGAGATGDFLHRLEIALTGDREAGLDDVDAHLLQQFGDLELLLEGHRGAGALLAVAQRGVEDDDAVLAGVGCGGGHGSLLPSGGRPGPISSAGVRVAARMRGFCSARSPESPAACGLPTLRGS